MFYRVPLVFDPDPIKGYTVTSPLLPELITCGDTFAEAYANAQDAMAAVVEIYEDFDRHLPLSLLVLNEGELICCDVLFDT